jgi:hypothetical protein
MWRFRRWADSSKAQHSVGIPKRAETRIGGSLRTESAEKRPEYRRAGRLPTRRQHFRCSYGLTVNLSKICELASANEMGEQTLLYLPAHRKNRILYDSFVSSRAQNEKFEIFFRPFVLLSACKRPSYLATGLKKSKNRGTGLAPTSWAFYRPWNRSQPVRNTRIFYTSNRPGSSQPRSSIWRFLFSKGVSLNP